MSEHHVVSAPRPVCPRAPASIPSPKGIKENAAGKKGGTVSRISAAVLGFFGRLSRHVSQVGLIVVRRT
jgi:hypothetical protein